VGHDVASSGSLTLPFAPTGIDVNVHAGSWAGYVTGMAFTLVGGAFVATGTTELLIWEGLGEPPVVNHTAGVLLPQGIVFLSVGAVFAAVGIPLWLANRTDVKISQHVAVAGRSGVELTTGRLVF
jgi:hypothetical protein